jgi:hypothetical protein
MLLLYLELPSWMLRDKKNLSFDRIFYPVTIFGPQNPGSG